MKGQPKTAGKAGQAHVVTRAPGPFTRTSPLARPVSRLFHFGVGMSGKPRRNFVPMPFYPLTVDTSPQERMFILALYHHDWDGVLAWPSQTRIATIMGCSKDTVARTQEKLIARNWLVVQKDKGKSNDYALNIPEMTLDEFNNFLKNQPQVAASPVSDPPQVAAPTSRIQRLDPPQVAAPTNNRTTEAEQINRTKADEAPDLKAGSRSKAKVSAAAKHPDQDAFWTAAKVCWQTYSGKPLVWPAPRDFQAKLTTGLELLGGTELLQRFKNHLASFGGQKSLYNIFYDLDKWAVAPQAKSAPARAFNAAAPASDFHTGPQRVI